MRIKNYKMSEATRKKMSKKRFEWWQKKKEQENIDLVKNMSLGKIIVACLIAPFSLFLK